MFTGIIEELGIVKNLQKKGSVAVLSVKAEGISSGTAKGDSISVNGVCLTVIDNSAGVLKFDISTETFKRSNIGNLKLDDRVNLERALKADSRLGGHFVFGHIDCTGKIILKERQGEFVRVEIDMAQSLMGYLIEKGSVAVDGISLTINTLGDKSFTVMLIPHTLYVTTLGSKQTGDYVNIEVDILAKYVEKLTNKFTRQPAKQPANISKDLLKEYGFI